MISSGRSSLCCLAVLRSLLLPAFAIFALSSIGAAYELSPHPRIFVNKAGLKRLAERAHGPLDSEYRLIKAVADRALAEGVRPPSSRYREPTDQLCLAITFLVERELGHEAERYAAAIRTHWGDGRVLSLEGSGHFGYYGMIYDWIYDAMTPEERVRFGNALGAWLRWYTGRPEITLKNGHWWYNQTWGPAHLNTPNTRDGIAPKLFVALALRGAGTEHEADAGRYLDSWARRVPAECIPAFDEMGGVWSESMGHGTYGPVIVIPWSFEAWRTATGEDLFQRCAPTGFLPDMTRWAVHLRVPFNHKTAWIDDNRAGDPRAFARVAPILAARYRNSLASAISDESFEKRWSRVPWNRFLSYDPEVISATPGQIKEPPAAFFKGAGHVYMRSRWADPDATWAFFGAGPKFGAHSRDDEGSFLIAKKGHLVLRAGGSGHNDRDYYAGGSLAFNIVTVFDPDEEFRRTTPGRRGIAEGGTKNERDGGLIRYVYSSHRRDDRGRIVSYEHDDRWTYAAADLTQGYRAAKVREVTRQFLYLRGDPEFFVIFDRVEATSASFPKTWFLHMPGEPSVTGRATVRTPGHVAAYDGDTATWLSDGAGERTVLSTGRSRAFLKTLLPEGATIVKRGGEGHDFWGHPHEPTAQYNHAPPPRRRSPVVPWRIEVEAPRGSERDYFLHVLEVGEEDDAKMAGAELLKSEGEFGVRLVVQGGPIDVLFAGRGPLAARVKVGDRSEVLGGPRATTEEPRGERSAANGSGDALPPDLAPYFKPPPELSGDFGDYRSPLEFYDGRPVRTPAEWSDRRREILERWHEIMGRWPPLVEKPELEYLERERRENFTQHRVRFEIAPGGRNVEGYLLVPDGEGPFPAVVVVYYDAGTGVGLGTELRDFGLQLARRGFVALSIGTPGSRYYPNESDATLQPLSSLAYAAANCYNLLANLAVVDSKRIGIVGHSYGGKWAMFASCLFEKFACAAWSDGGIVFDETRPNVNYWEPWYLGYERGDTKERGTPSKEKPRVGAYRRLVEGGHDLHELHALMAPRPFLVSGGSEDRPERWKPLNHSIAVNRLLGAENRVAMTNRPRHSPTPESNEQIYRFFEHFLKK